MKNLNELIEQGKNLVEKRTWLRKSFMDLWQAINKELAGIPDTDFSIDCSNIPLYKRTKFNKNYGSYECYYYVKLQFDNACLDLYYSAEMYDNDYLIDVNSMSPADFPISFIREFGEKLEEILNFFITEINARNEENSKAIEFFDSVINSIKAGKEWVRQ